MKKLILSLAIIVIASLSATAQTEKGSWLIGGSASFSSSTGSTSLSIEPKAGYFFSNNWAAGLGLNFTSQSSDGFSTTAIIGAPFIRYYFLPLGDNVKLFGNGLIGIGNISGGGSSSFTTWQLSAGPAVFLNKHTALEFALAYGGNKYSGSGAINTFAFLVGFQIHLPGKGKK